MTSDRPNVIELLEKALAAAKNPESNMLEVGCLARKAANAAGVPDDLLTMSRKIRTEGYGVEADLLGFAIDAASAAVTQDGEVYAHALVSIHDTACERLDDIEDDAHASEDEAPNRKPTTTVSRLN